MLKAGLPLALLFASFASASAQTATREEVAALKGLKAVFTGEVLISNQTSNDSAAPDAENLDDLLQTKLTEGKIRLVDAKSLAAGSKTFDIPHVTVNVSVTILKPINGLVTYAIRVEAYEDAQVVRTEKLMAATVWERTLMATVERKGLTGSIKEDLDSALADFVKAYKAANPA